MSLTTRSNAAIVASASATAATNSNIAPAVAASTVVVVACRITKFRSSSDELGEWQMA